MNLRQYTPADCGEMCRLFYDTVHTVNAKDYTKEQLDAWATKNPDTSRWNTSLSTHYTLVAVENGKIVGFGDMDKSGYLDHLYVHKDFQRRGIGTALCDALECAYGDTLSVICTHASVTAKPFFIQRGYQVITAQQVERQGVYLENFRMQKTRK
ncbi:MAG: GNAT family N-acetyltransferase [Candidatus Fimenecus sp.]